MEKRVANEVETRMATTQSSVKQGFMGFTESGLQRLVLILIILFLAWSISISIWKCCIYVRKPAIGASYERHESTTTSCKTKKTAKSKKKTKTGKHAQDDSKIKVNLHGFPAGAKCIVKQTAPTTPRSSALSINPMPAVQV